MKMWIDFTRVNDEALTELLRILGSTIWAPLLTAEADLRAARSLGEDAPMASGAHVIATPIEGLRIWADESADSFVEMQAELLDANPDDESVEADRGVVYVFGQLLMAAKQAVEFHEAEERRRSGPPL